MSVRASRVTTYSLSLAIAVVALAVAFAAVVPLAVAEPLALTATVSVAGQNPYSVSAEDLASVVGTGTLDPTGLTVDEMTAEQKAAITALATKVAAAYYRAPIAGTYAYSGTLKRMYIRGGVAGFSLDAAAVETAIYAGLAAYNGDGSVEIATSGTVSSRAMGKAIVVDQSLRYLYLYSGGRVVTKYRCTVGMSAYRTPNGYFTIGAKRKNPSWGNPGSPWAKNMPKYIKPGPSNPLGVRAMNLNNTAGRDTGLRIHGTSRTWEIGRAASHGCVRLTNTNVTKLFDLVTSGTPVIIQP